MIIKDFTPFEGENCENTMVGNLLKHAGGNLSEPLLFGIGEGLSFIYWDSKQMGYPFLGGRIKQDELTDNIIKNLGLNMEIQETSSVEKAWLQVKERIDSGIPVGLKLDSYYLEYFHHKLHFAAHYVTLYGYDDKDGYLVDTKQQGTLVKSSLQSIAQGRSAKGPMSSKNRSFAITKEVKLPDMEAVIPGAIHRNAEAYLNPPIQNIAGKGIAKTAKLMPKWMERPDMTPETLFLMGTLMERAGTGGALFRNLYRDFLKESHERYPKLGLGESYEQFCEIAELWTRVSALICQAGEEKASAKLEEASRVMLDIAAKEEAAMKGFLRIV